MLTLRFCQCHGPGSVTVMVKVYSMPMLCIGRCNCFGRTALDDDADASADVSADVSAKWDQEHGRLGVLDVVLDSMP